MRKLNLSPSDLAAHKKRLKQAQSKRYYSRYKDRINAYTVNWIKRNKAKKHEYDRKAHNKMYQNNPNYRTATCLRARLGRALANQGAKKYDSTLSLLGCTVGRFRKYIQGLFLVGMSWENYGHRSWHIDHIRPCSSFDLTDPEQQRQCFHYTNMQPLWASDNLKKSNKI